MYCFGLWCEFVILRFDVSWLVCLLFGVACLLWCLCDLVLCLTCALDCEAFGWCLPVNFGLRLEITSGALLWICCSRYGLNLTGLRCVGLLVVF